LFISTRKTPRRSRAIRSGKRREIEGERREIDVETGQIDIFLNNYARELELRSSRRLAEECLAISSVSLDSAASP
jgi:hypothetical protein